MLGAHMMSAEQIASAFGLTERPVKRLIRDYFVQFDRSFIRKGQGPKIGDQDLPTDQIPQEYSEIAGMLKLVHGDATKNKLDTEIFTPDSLLKIPERTGHLGIPQKKNEDGSIAMWAFVLHLRNATDTFNKQHFIDFCNGTPDPKAATETVANMLKGFYPAAHFVFGLLKSKNTVMNTLTLVCRDDKIFIQDSRFNISPNKCLIVKLEKKDNETQ